MGLESWCLELTPIAAMVMLQCLEIGLTTLSKEAMSKGMSRFILVVYSNALATLILLPYALFVERKKRPPLNFSILCKLFLLSLAGVTLMQNCAFTGIDYSSPTLASAINNLVPAFTFILGVIFRMEKLDLKYSRSLVKIMGTLVLISGAMIIVFYKGSSIGTMSDSSTENTYPSNQSSTENYWILGGLFIAIAALSKAVSIIGQAAVIKEYPSQVTVVAFYCLFGTIQSAAFTLFVESDPNAWRLTANVELISVLYTAIIGNALALSVQMWCIQKKGPLFVAMFSPLGIAIAAIMGTIFLGDTLYVGSVIGAVVIVIGFYGVMWAQCNSTEKSETHEVDRTQSSKRNTPLLESYLPV